jgi:hypothetical protein
MRTIDANTKPPRESFGVSAAAPSRAHGELTCPSGVTRSLGPAHARVIALLAGLALFTAPALAEPMPADSTATSSPFYSTEDGMFDISTFMEGRHEFLPIPFPITEPAVGYGGGVMLVFIDKPRAAAQAGFGRPNISMVGGLATENGTWMTMLADIRYWRKDRLKTLVAGATGLLELDFGGIGTETGGERPLQHYNLEPNFLTLQAMQRLGTTRMWAGLRYAYGSSEVTFEAPANTPGIPDQTGRSDVGSLAPSLIYDARDNNFTPLSGTYAEIYSGFYRDWLGSDDDFESVEFCGIQYLPLAPKLFLGLRADARRMGDGAPFYVLPYVEMRGVPAVRYQGQVVAQAEVEMRWQALGRWSVVGFAGTGAAALEVGQLSSTHAVQAGVWASATNSLVASASMPAWTWRGGRTKRPSTSRPAAPGTGPRGSLRRGLARFARIAAGCGRNTRRMLAGGREVDHVRTCTWLSRCRRTRPSPASASFGQALGFSETVPSCSSRVPPATGRRR